MKLAALSILIAFLSYVVWTNDSQNGMVKYRFDKGSHFSKPRNFFTRGILLPDTLRWLCRFDASCCYHITQENGKLHIDQWDYNKLMGITFSPWNPHKNTAMVGWRHNPRSGLLELIPYWHVSNKRFFNEKPYLTVEPFETFTVEMVADKMKKEVTILIKTEKYMLKDSKVFENVPNRASLINPYFGGTSRAPSVMDLYLMRLE